MEREAQIVLDFTKKALPPNTDMRYLAFLIYILIWDGGILAATYYAVFILGHSGWWFLFALLLCGASFKPRHFGIEQFPDKDNENS